MEVRKGCEHAMSSTSFKTLMDYDGPTVMGDIDDRRDEDLTSHVRVKRSEAATHTIGRTTFEFNGFRTADSNRKNGSIATGMTVGIYRRHKRGVLLENRQRTKRVKGNAGHSKHRMKTQTRNKEREASKSSRKSSAKGSGSELQNNKKVAVKLPGVSELHMDSREKRALGSGSSSIVRIVNSADYEESSDRKYFTSLSGDNSSSEEQRRRNVVTLPLVHTVKTELRVRIEKIPTHESSLANLSSWANFISTTESSRLCTVSSRLKNDVINEVTDNYKFLNVTNFKLALDFNSGKKEANNSNIPSTGSVLSRIENANLKVGKEGRKFAGSADEDAKSRAKRNQIMYKHCLEGDLNAIGPNRFKDTIQKKSIANVKHEEKRYVKTRDDRAVSAIEEIKELAERLVVKVNALQIYVNNYSEVQHTTYSPDCPSKSPNSISNDHHRHSTKSNGEAVPIGRKASRMSLRFAREYRNGKRPHRKWNRWTDWSSCSVTCGKGRQIRWRHCMRNCDDAETEMEEKACQLPACLPGKFLGIF